MGSKHDKIMVLERNCPSCGSLIKYSRNHLRRRADKNNNKCKSCVNKKENNPMFGLKGTLNPLYGRQGIKTFLGKTHTLETRKKLSEIAKKRTPWFLGKNHSEETKKKLGIIASNRSEEHICKLRQKRVEFIEKHGGNRSFNLCACSVFSLMNLIKGWDGQHAKNKGEKIVEGYYLDYFCEKQKLIIEWDEKAHLYGKRQNRDAKKTKRLSEFFGKDWLIVRWDAFNKKIRQDFSVFNGRESEANNVAQLLNIC